MMQGFQGRVRPLAAVFVQPCDNLGHRIGGEVQGRGSPRGANDGLRLRRGQAAAIDQPGGARSGQAVGEGASQTVLKNS